MRGDPQQATFDSVPLGFILGLLFPVLGFYGYGTIYVTAIRPHHDLRRHLFVTPEHDAQHVLHADHVVARQHH